MKDHHESAQGWRVYTGGNIRKRDKTGKEKGEQPGVPVPHFQEQNRQSYHQKQDGVESNDLQYDYPAGGQKTVQLD